MRRGMIHAIMHTYVGIRGWAMHWDGAALPKTHAESLLQDCCLCFVVSRGTQEKAC